MKSRTATPPSASSVGAVADPIKTGMANPQRAPFRWLRDGDSPQVRLAYKLGAEGSPATDGERELFESWMRGHCWQCGEWNGQAYPDMTTRVLWAAWRDRAALAIAIPVPPGPSGSTDGR